MDEVPEFLANLYTADTPQIVIDPHGNVYHHEVGEPFEFDPDATRKRAFREKHGEE